MRIRALCCTLPILLAGTGAHAADDMTEKLARFIVGHAGAAIAECPQQTRDLYPERLMICAAYGGSWSRFKSDWDFVLDRYDLPASVEAQTAWTRKQGRYVREYSVERGEITVVFDEQAQRVLFAYTLEGVEDDADFAVRGETGQGSTVRVAGFGGVGTPRLREDGRVEPAYPPEAQEQGIEGSVALSAVILADGTVGKLKVLAERPEGHGFAEAALAAVRHWLYEPAHFEGQPVDVSLTVYVPFKP